jgi:hypothetical protein
MEKAQYQEEIKRQVQEQVNTVIQDYLEKNSGPTGVTQNQFETFLELQNKNFRDLSFQLMQMVIAQRNDSEAQQGIVTVPYGKRSVGTTGDTSSITDSNMEQQEDRKRLDCKPTPTKNLYPRKASPATTDQSSQPKHIPDNDGKSLSTQGEDTMDSMSQTQESPLDQDNHWRGITSPVRIFNDHSMSIDTVDDITNKSALHTEMHTAGTGLSNEGNPGYIHKDGYSTPN